MAPVNTPGRASVARLQRLVAVLEAGDDPDGRWLAEGLALYFAEATSGGRSLEFYLDLAPTLGGTTWLEEARRGERDSLLHDIAIRHFPGQDPGPTARALAAAWRRYARNRLANDRRRGDSAGAPGTFDADLFTLARLGGPPADRRLRDILASAEQPDAA